MPPVEKDIIAALLKSIGEHGLIPEQTYRASLNKLFYTFDANAPLSYDDCWSENSRFKRPSIQVLPPAS